ncbi:nuclear transport factor 2 family protein [Saccharomonospora sp. NPDC046836]|uniref:nuclear transport factor 2 family protein n=1 Tax=Saccharomonospora sp. NPDC046836 TaxID=3156921 RepID=UPI0033FA4C12
MRKRTSFALIAATLAVTIAAGMGFDSAPASAGPKQRAEESTRAFLAALERKDVAAVNATIDKDATLTIPLSFSGAQQPEAHFVGKEQVAGYIGQVFATMETIRFTDVRVSVTDRGRTAFVQANGDFTTADGRSYRNVYVFRHDWKNGRIVRTEEYGNPVTFCKTFGGPNC